MATAAYFILILLPGCLLLILETESQGTNGNDQAVFRIRDLHSLNCRTVANVEFEDSLIIQQDCASGQEGQTWQQLSNCSNGYGTHQLLNADSGLCSTVVHGTLRLSPCNEHDQRQRFRRLLSKRIVVNGQKIRSHQMLLEDTFLCLTVAPNRSIVTERCLMDGNNRQFFFRDKHLW